MAGIIEIDGKVEEEFNFKMRPFKGQLVDKKALEVNGISLVDLRKYPDPAVQFNKLIKILDKYIDKYQRNDKFYAVGQNIKFDLDFLNSFFVSCCNKYMGSYIHHHAIDLIAITCFMKLAGKFNPENLKLETVMKELDIGSQSHDALDDIKNTRKVFYKYMEWL